jgi:hypothetical protein
MTIAKIRAALETRLGTVTPAIPVAYENTAYSPVAGVMYQRANLLPNTPDDGQIGSSVYMEKGIFQVTVCAPMNNGPAAAEARAQLVKDAFKRGTSVVNGGVTVIIMNAPSVSSAMIDGDRFCIPVSMRYQAQIVT